MQFIIEKNIPLKENYESKKDKLSEIPLTEMEVGDSVLIPISFLTNRKLGALIWRYNKKVNKEFIIRKIDNTANRIFRIK